LLAFDAVCPDRDEVRSPYIRLLQIIVKREFALSFLHRQMHLQKTGLPFIKRSSNQFNTTNKTTSVESNPTLFYLKFVILSRLHFIHFNPDLAQI
jgi:hypothetical protein